MKRLILILMVAVFIAGMLISCNQNTCPAYSSTDNSAHIEKNA